MDDQVLNYLAPIYYFSCLSGMFPLNRRMAFKIYLAVLNFSWLLLWVYAGYVLSQEKITHGHVLLIYYKILLSLSNFCVTEFQSIYHRRDLKNVLTVFSEVINIPPILLCLLVKLLDISAEN